MKYFLYVCRMKNILLIGFILFSLSCFSQGKKKGKLREKVKQSKIKSYKEFVRYKSNEIFYIRGKKSYVSIW